MDVGIDILEIPRIGKLLRRHRAHFVRRTFTDREIAAFPRRRVLYYALGFSFKEALWKTLPPRVQKQTWFNDIEIVWRQNRPQVFLRGRKLENVDLKFGHDAKTVITTVTRHRKPFHPDKAAL